MYNLHESLLCFSRMDFNKWNSFGKGEQRTLKKVSDLEINRTYLLQCIHKTITKYGNKITVGLEGDIYCYLPAKLSEALLANDEAGLQEVKEEQEKGTVGLRRLPQRGRFNPVEFVPLIL